MATQQRTSAEPEATPSRLSDLVRAHLDLVLYGVFGVLTTLVNIVSYWAFAHVLGLGTLVSSVLAWVASVAFAYLTNRRWVFQSEARGAAAIAKEATSFFAARLATGALDWAGMWLLVDVARLPDMPVKLALNVAVIVLNFVLSKLVVFRKPR